MKITDRVQGPPPPKPAETERPKPPPPPEKTERPEPPKSQDRNVGRNVDVKA